MLDKTQPKSYGLPTDWCRVVWVTVNRLQGITARSGHISWCLREQPTRATRAGPSPVPTGEITTMPGKDGAFLRSTANEAPRARVGLLQATRIFLHPHVGGFCGFFRPRVLNQDTGLTPGRRPSSRTTTWVNVGVRFFKHRHGGSARPLSIGDSEEMKESPWSFRRPALAGCIRGAHSGMLQDSQGVKARGMSDKAGTNNQVVLIKLQPNVAWTVPFKETPVGGCRRGQERSGTSNPSAAYRPTTSSCVTAPMRELRTSPFHWGGQEKSRRGGSSNAELGDTVFVCTCVMFQIQNKACESARFC